MNFFKESVGEWWFEYQFKPLNIKEFFRLPLMTQNAILDKRLMLLQKSLEALGRNNFFKIKEVEFFKAQKISTELIEDIESGLNIENIKKLIFSNKTLWFGFFGKTLVFENESKKFVLMDEVIKVSFDLAIGDLIISTRSDIWSPFSVEGHLQLDLAKMNYPRLEKVLKDIKSINDDVKIIPDHNEVETQYLLPQKGFKFGVFDFNYEEYTEGLELTTEQEQELQKFIIPSG